MRPKPDELLVEISHPVRPPRTTASLLPNPLPLTVKLVVAPAVPCVVAGNVNELVLTLNTDAAVVKLYMLDHVPYQLPRA